MSHEFTRSVSRREFLIGSGAAGAVALAGCTSDSTGDDGLSGDIRISGSSTIYPIAQEMSRQFKQDHPDVGFDLTRDGSSGGFRNVFIPGDSDINNASRKITEDEIQQCEDNGFTPVEFYIAQDAITVVVNNEADFIEDISLDELRQIWSAETAPDTWQDVRSSWPDKPFDLYGPATTSGTYDYFSEEVIGEDGEMRGDFQGTEQDDQIAAGVSGNQYAMGYLPFAYYTNNPDETKALAVSGGGEPVEPSLEGAQSGNYPLARPLFFYANSNKLEEKTHLQEFVEFYVETVANEDLIAGEIGYVPSTQEMVDENLSTLEEYTG